MLVGSFARTCRAGRILASSPEPDDATRDSQHPKHPDDCVTITCSCQDTTNNDHSRGNDNGSFTTKIIACQANGNLT